MVSIIIVNFQSKKELFDCIESISKSKSKTPYEIIVVDNNEKNIFGKELKKKYRYVKYIHGQGNVGFGKGNNIGSEIAKGELLFFLNPDTKIFLGAIDNLVSFLNKNKKAGIVAPLLHTITGEPYQQGTLELTPLRAIASLSFLHKLFPNNPITKKYYLKDWDKKTLKEVDVIPGTAFIIRKNIFEKTGGFDSNFFLYFEEFDLCKRVKKLGWKIYILPTAKIIHHWGASTKQVSNIQQIFTKSRYYYFKKHFGIINALLVEAILQFNKYAALLLLIIVIGVFLRLFYLHETMSFIGDQGWFYLSARDILLTGNIPLVGITSSHPWLHQGAFWTYILSGVFWLFGFNPMNGGYLAVLIDAVTIALLYKVGSKIFSKNTGIIAAALYATSPLIVFDARTPYHTTPISLFTIIYIYLLYKWISGNKYMFPLLIMDLVVLYNFELATILLGFFTFTVLIYGIYKKAQWVLKLLNKKIISLSIGAFIFPMLPMLIYDTSHHFAQTFGLLLWTGYRVLLLFGYPPVHPEQTVAFGVMNSFVFYKYQTLIFPYSGFVTLVVFLIGIVWFVVYLFKKQKKNNILLIVLLNVFLLGGFLASRSPSNAYLPMITPCLLLLTAIVTSDFIKRPFLKLPVILLLLLAGIANSHFLISNYISDSASGGTFKSRLDKAKYIVYESRGKEYNLIRKGVGSEFESLSMNYEYLTWWLGHAPSKKPQQLQFVIDQTNEGTKVYKDTHP